MDAAGRWRAWRLRRTRRTTRIEAPRRERRRRRYDGRTGATHTRRCAAAHHSETARPIKWRAETGRGQDGSRGSPARSHAQVTAIGPGSWRLWQPRTRGDGTADGPHPSTRPKWLAVFAGRLERAVHLPGALAKCGMDVDVIDSHPTVGGQAHDLLVHDTREAVLADMKAGKYAGAWIATPCSLYSIRRTPQLFSRSGRAVPASSRHLVEQTNELARFTAELIRAADAAGTHWALEGKPSRQGRHQLRRPLGSLR